MGARKVEQNMKRLGRVLSTVAAILAVLSMVAMSSNHTVVDSQYNANMRQLDLDGSGQKLGSQDGVSAMPPTLKVAKASSTIQRNRAPKGVIFLLIDDIGYGDIDALYPSSLETPNIDSFYRESVRLTDYHSNTTCSPSRASLMTGRYNNSTGVWHTNSSRGLLRADEQTMADVFQANGWNTGAFGKWHLGDGYPFAPEYRGFDKTVMHKAGRPGTIGDYWGNDNYSGEDRKGRPTEADVYYENGEPRVAGQFATNFWFDEAKSFMEDSVDDDKPFFVYLPTNAAHSPFNAPFGYKARMDGLIENVDDNLGWLDDFLEAQGIKDDVLLVFSSDNGTVSKRLGDLQGKKASYFDGGHNVPMFLRWKNGNIGGSSRAARDVDSLTSIMDFLPTFIDLFDLNRPSGGKPFDGISIAEMLTNPNYTPRSRQIVIDTQRDADLKKWKNTSVLSDEVSNGRITNKWRLTRASAGASVRLFDVMQDRGQTTNIAQGNSATVRSLTEFYESWWSDTSRGWKKYPAFVIDPSSESELLLTARDWLDKAVNSSGAVLKGEKTNAAGVHPVRFEQSGRYRFELRRWPREEGSAINSQDAEKKGVAIDARTAEIEIGGVGKFTSTIRNNAKSVVFQVDVPAGSQTTMSTALKDSNGQILSGAYYTYIRRVGAAAGPAGPTTGAIVYADANFEGASWEVDVGTYRATAVRESPVGVNAISSIQIAPGYSVRLCKNSRRGGSGICETLTSSASDLGALDNKTSHILITATG